MVTSECPGEEDGEADQGQQTTNVQTISKQVVPTGNTIWRLWTAGNKCPDHLWTGGTYRKHYMKIMNCWQQMSIQPISEQVVPTGNTIWGSWTAGNKCPAHLGTGQVVPTGNTIWGSWTLEQLATNVQPILKWITYFFILFSCVRFLHVPFLKFHFLYVHFLYGSFLIWFILYNS